MSERITQRWSRARRSTTSTRRSASLERTTDELSSGKTILEPSDNPYGASQVIDLQSQLDGLSSYESNAQDGISWENTASSAMSSMGQVAQRVRELLVQAANGTYNQGDLETMALRGRTADRKPSSRTPTPSTPVSTCSRGRRTTTAPYEQGAGDEYKGNAETRQPRGRARRRRSTITTNISTLLGNGEASEDGKLLDTLRTIAKNMRAGTPEEREALGTTDLQNLDGEHRNADPAAGGRGQRDRSAADRADPQRRAADVDHAGAVEHRRHERRHSLDRVRQRAGRLRGRAARRREHRPGIAAQLPAVDERQGEPHHVRDIREHPLRHRRDRASRT